MRDFMKLVESMSGLEYRLYARAANGEISQEDFATYTEASARFEELMKTGQYDALQIYDVFVPSFGKQPGGGCVRSNGRDVDLLTGIDYGAF